MPVSAASDYHVVLNARNQDEMSTAIEYTYSGVFVDSGVYYISDSGGGSGTSENDTITFSGALSRLGHSAHSEGECILTESIRIESSEIPPGKNITLTSLGNHSVNLEGNGSLWAPLKTRLAF